LEAKEFIELLSDHDKVKHKSVEELKNLSLEFPYSQPVQLLYTIRLGQSSEYLFNRQLGKTAILTNDRTVLFDLFEREEDTVVESPTSPTVVRELPEEPRVTKMEEKPEPKEEDRLEHTILKTVTDEPESHAQPEELEEQVSTAGEEQNLKDKVKAILEENRRLRQKYEGSQKENSAINQRISEIKDRLDRIKVKQDEPAAEPQVQADEADTQVTPEQEIREEPVQDPLTEEREETDAYSADEEALIEERNSADEGEEMHDIIPEAETAEESKEVEKEPVFTIDDEGDEELSFSGWIHRLSEGPHEEESQPQEEQTEGSEEIQTAEVDVAEEVEEAAEPEERPALTAKFELFDSFVEKLPELKRRKPENAMNRRQEEDLSDEDSSLVTETLAKVYMKQKHYDKAIKAYEILRLKYPEKSGFFADRIFEIKKLSNS
jgi:hypothetical protein